MSEAALQRRMQRKIKEMGGYVVKYHGGRFSIAGTPDLLVCYRGHFIGLEVKKPGGDGPSKIQELKIEEIRRAGGTAEVVRSVKEVQDVLLSV